MNDAWSFHFFWFDAVIEVACVVSWTSLFNCQMVVVVNFYICWLEWFRTDWVVGGVVVFPPLLVALLYSLHCSWVSRFIGILLVSCCLQMVSVAKTWSKNFSAASSRIYLGWFKVLPITAFHVNAAFTWYLMLVLDGEFWRRWLTRVLFT